MHRKIAEHPIYEFISDGVDRAIFAQLSISDNRVVIPFTCSFKGCEVHLQPMTAFQRVKPDGWCQKHKGVSFTFN